MAIGCPRTHRPAASDGRNLRRRAGSAAAGRLSAGERSGRAALAAAVLAATHRAERIADLFCGAGTFSLPLAVNGARVDAVDGDAEALAALAQATRTLPHVRCERRDLFARPLAAAELNGYDAVVFDPPRSGASAQASALAASAVPIVVAVSCNADTFARDARLLAAGGYRLARITPVDQFLWTPHIELCAVFHR
jgi:23S rRNA (uracil1939-C5)-methyltransferase